MRTLITTAFVSLDGVIEAPGGDEDYRHAGWTFEDIEFSPEVYELKGREQDEATAMPKYVVSSTLSDDDLVDNWGETTILR